MAAHARGPGVAAEGRPLPPITAETRPFWDGCRQGELRYQVCRACGRPQFYPRVLCAQCGGIELDWRRSAGTGAVHAVTVVHRPPSAEFRDAVPYAIALVDLDEGFRLMANVVGADPARVAIGDRVRVVFEARGDVTLPQFTPASPGGAASPLAGAEVQRRSSPGQ